MNTITKTVILACFLLLALSSSGCATFDKRAFLHEEGHVAMAKGYYVEALMVYRPLALQGDKVAQFHLARLFRDGLGIVYRNTERALRWYTESARRGYLKSQLFLANTYYSGNGRLGIERDFKKAAHWYREAAAQGNAFAQNNLGVMYCFGRGVRRDYRRAAHWIRLAADQGRAEAQYNLGALYYKGLGVKKNLMLARHWFSSAAIGGHSNAQIGLAAVAQRLNFNRS